VENLPIPHLSTRLTLTQALNDLRESILTLGENCCQGLDVMSSSLSVSSEIFEHQLSDLEIKVKDLANITENKVFSILTLQQPLLKDLRFVVSVLQMLSHLCKVIYYAHRLTTLSNMIDDKTLISGKFRELAENCQFMLKDAMNAFSTESTDLAMKLVEKDKENDLLHDTSFQEIVRQIAHQDKQKVQTSAYLLTQLRLLERTGDAITSIAKEIYFIHSGQRI